MIQITQTEASAPGTWTGQIVAVHRNRYEIETEQGHLFGTLKASEYYRENRVQAYPVTGDMVTLLPNPAGDSLITATLNRRTAFSRKDPDDGMGEQVLAANFDYIFIMMALNGDFNLKRLDRYLVAGAASGAETVVILTKSDLVADSSPYIQKVKEYAKGVRVHAVSAMTGDGFEELREYLRPGRTLIFLGSSGVGKSTFTNALLGEKVMDTGDIREDDSKGRHTTTHRQMFTLENGVKIIDTPGMRELELWDGLSGIDEGFAQIQALGKLCRFSDCSHHKEPGCAVRAAMESGELDGKRYLSYQKLEKEARFLREKERHNQIKTGRSSGRKPKKRDRQIEKEWD